MHWLKKQNMTGFWQNFSLLCSFSFVDQTRPVPGFEGFPGTHPDHHSTGWSKCYLSMSFCAAEIEGRARYLTREPCDAAKGLLVLFPLVLHWSQIQMDHLEMRHGAFEFLSYIGISLQAHSHVRKLLSNAPVESVVRVTGIVSSRPPGQENRVRMLGSLKVFIPLGEESTGQWGYSRLFVS